MEITSLPNSLDIEAFLNKNAAELTKSSGEDKKITQARIQSRSSSIQDKRQERIEQLQEQIKGAHPRACPQFLVNLTKIFDTLLKPLSALTLGKLNLELSKSLEMLLDAKGEVRFQGLQIQGKEMQNVIEELKKFLQGDIEHLESTESFQNNSEQNILDILDQIHQSFENVSKA